MGCVGPRPGTPPSESDSHPAGARAAVITRRFWAAARSADAARPAPPGVNTLIAGTVDLTPWAAPKHRAHLWVPETVSWPLTCNVPSMAPRPPRSILEAHHRTALGSAANQPETSGHHGDPHMVQTLQVRAHDIVLAPNRRHDLRSTN